MSSSLLQVFVELGNLHATSNYVLYWNHGGRLFWFRLPWPGTSVKYSCILLACSEDWTCNLQMIVFLVAQGTNAYNHYTMWPAEWIFGYYKLNVLTIARITTIMYDFFYLCSYSDFSFFFFFVLFFYLAFLIIGSHIVFNSTLGLLSRSL